jgi:PEP-CTERM/exosortase A-associated glycosyltransferase
MRVLHILDHSLPLQSGYVFRTLAILKQQRALGWETFHLTTPKHTVPCGLSETVDGWHFYRTPTKANRLGQVPLLSEFDLMTSTAARLAEVISEVRPDVLHAHSPLLNCLPALWSRRKHRIPVVYEVRAFWEDAAVSHGTHREHDLRYYATRRLETYALRQADAVTTICEGLKQDILARGIPERKVTVIPNAVDIEEFAPAAPPDPALRTRLGLDGATVLGFFGSFYHYEGLHVLLDALPELLRAEPSLRVLLAGGGPEEENLAAQARRLGLEDSVRFLGRIKHAEMQRYYSLADILVYPRISIRLTELVTPLKPLEAMAQGKIVLASDVGGHRELIRSGSTGYLFPADGPGGVVAGVLDALNRRGEWPEMRAAARRFVETERSWQKSVARYENVYGAITAARAAA